MSDTLLTVIIAGLPALLTALFALYKTRLDHSNIARKTDLETLREIVNTLQEERQAQQETIELLRIGRRTQEIKLRELKHSNEVLIQRTLELVEENRKLHEVIGELRAQIQACINT